jgi:L-fuconolactonase
LARDEPRIKGIIAQQDLSQDLRNSSAFDELQKIDILKGIRSKFEPDSPHYLDNLQVLPVLDLTCDLLLSSSQLEDAAHIVAQCPDTRFILDHLGNPDIKNGDINTWKEGISILAGHSNVCCKISGIITRIGEGWTLDSIRPYAMHVFQEFGVDRLVYGGDWPVVLLADSYRSWSRAFERLTGDFSETDLEKIYYKNADRIYNL